jgi:hypothetical protein
MRDYNETPKVKIPRFKITVKSDIYQLGLIFGYILVDRGFHTKRDKNKSSNTFEVKLNMLAIYRIKTFIDEGLSDFRTEILIRNMIYNNPGERFDAENVIKNPFFWDVEKVEKFFCQILADHKGHASNPDISKKIDIGAKFKVFNELSWLDILGDEEIEMEKNKFLKTSKLDENSFLDLVDFIIQVVSFK